MDELGDVWNGFASQFRPYPQLKINADSWIAILGSFFRYAGGRFSHPVDALFWISGIPEVYVLIIPCFAFASEIFRVFSRKPIFGYPVMVGAHGL